MSQDKTPVLVCGFGKVGEVIARGIREQSDMHLMGIIDHEKFEGADSDFPGTYCTSSLKDFFIRISHIGPDLPKVMVDFTNAEAVAGSVSYSVARGLSCVVGTTGLSDSQREHIKESSERFQQPVLIIPNFAIGAVHMMMTAAMLAASGDFSHATIIERHHEKKVDAPSGTALATACLMYEARGCDFETTLYEGDSEVACGINFHGIRVLSVRQLGSVAHQEVIFGAQGQTLTIRHDAPSREAYIPGVLMAIRKIQDLEPGLHIGLETVLALD